LTLDANSYLSIPGYLKLNLYNDFEIIGNQTKGGTALIQKAKIVNPELLAKYDFKEAAIKLMLDTKKSQDDIFKFEIALLGSVIM
jgi:hypothetical protein